MTSGGLSGDQVFDGEGLDPRTKVLPGKKAIWSATFGVKDPADITLRIDPNYQLYDDVTFFSQAQDPAPSP